MQTWGDVEKMYREAEEIAEKYNLKIVEDVTPGESDWIMALDVAEVIKKLEAEIERLEKKERWLTCLEIAGVDNWQGYEFAYEAQKEYFPEDYEDD